MKPVLKTRDKLVAALMATGKRDDLYIRNVWDCFQHFLAVYHMDQNISRIADTLPSELKDRLAA